MFSNPWPHDTQRLRDIFAWKFGGFFHQKKSDAGAPWQQLTHEFLHTKPTHDWRIIWLGHASFLLQGQSCNLLIDPVFADYCSPVPISSLRRLSPPPCSVADLPRIDAILLTHSHYDHLCLPTLRSIPGDPVVFVPSGHAAWMRKNTSFSDVRELAWNESCQWDHGLEIHSVPAQHFTARTLWDRNHGHWCGWVIQSSEHKIWHMGDSGYCPAFLEIGERFGEIDLAMIPIGAYEPRKIMKAIHVNPAEAVQAFLDARCQKAIAMHWGTFRLTDESSEEQQQELLHALTEKNIPLDRFITLPVGGVYEL